MKACAKCFVLKPMQAFYQHPSIKSKDGRRTVCEECRNIYRKRHHAENPEIIKRQKRSWGSRNKDRVNLLAREYRQQNPDKFRDYHYKSQFGITLELYNQILEIQGYVCAICRQPESALLRGKVKKLAVDHNHKTGAVRGLLCTKCNPGIGYFEDDIARLTAAINYIKATK